MPEPNEEQKKLCDTLDGFIIVDAGPGTGKTQTIVERYAGMIERNIDPMDMLMLTFTRNAAEEMETRIVSRLSEKFRGKKGGLSNRIINNLRISTMDSFCLDVVLNSPEKVMEFFDEKDSSVILSRSAALIENETLNRQYFSEFYSRFIRDHGSDYIFDGKDIAATVGDYHMDVYELLCKLMSRGIIPKKKGWAGNAKDILIGDRKATADLMRARNSKIASKLKTAVGNGEFPQPVLLDDSKTVSEEMIEQAAYDDREGLIRFIHDVYYGYIVQCIKDNRLTFGLTELFAFIILLTDKGSRSMHSVDYLTIDEFQDTNELQMKICLLLLKRPNMCVVGDWKQGIFAFRYVSIDNITDFENRIRTFMEELEDSGIEFPFPAQGPKPIEFVDNYRSSSGILEQGFDALEIPASEEDVPVNGDIVELNSVKDGMIGPNSEIRCIRADDLDGEIRKAVDMITEYRFSGKYTIVEEKDGKTVQRGVEFGDIAVLCRSCSNCTEIFEECKQRRIPAFLQGDVEIMSTDEGKLALAWLRAVNNMRDERGLTAILTHRGCSLGEIERIKASGWQDLPKDLEDDLYMLRGRRRRLNELLTNIFNICNMNNGITQTITSVLASTHDNSLMTISDLIRLMEDDIEASTRYNVEPLLDSKAVTIQTIHKSKGLEYPIVIIVGLDKNSFPSTRTDYDSLIFNDTIGLRCTKEHISSEEDGVRHEMIVKSWKTAMVRYGIPMDYSEERRLLFVGMTRAKQYLSLTAYRPSKFFEFYENRFGTKDPIAMNDSIEMETEHADRPELGDYQRVRSSLSVHDLMSTLPEPSGVEKREGRGKEYGDIVHNKAYQYLIWKKYDDSVPEMDNIRKVIEGLKGAKLSGEIKCILPVDDVSVKGTIDLLAEFDDRIEIHDYKTDLDTCYRNQYQLQLSVYAHAAASLGKEVRCFINFVALDEHVEVEILSMDYIRERIAEYWRQLTLPETTKKA